MKITAKSSMEIRDFDWSDLMPSEFGRVFASRAACEFYCQREGFLVIARIQGNSGVFYAPYLRVDGDGGL